MRYKRIINKLNQMIASFIASLMCMTTIMSITSNAETKNTVFNYDTYIVENNVVKYVYKYNDIKIS